MTRWQAFWQRILSPPTARFILALLALFFAAGGAFYLMSGQVEGENKDAAIFALGALFGLAPNGFNYYFGSTARGDEKPVEAEIVNPPEEPVPVKDG